MLRRSDQHAGAIDGNGAAEALVGGAPGSSHSTYLPPLSPATVAPEYLCAANTIIVPGAACENSVTIDADRCPHGIASVAEEGDETRQARKRSNHAIVFVDVDGAGAIISLGGTYDQNITVETQRTAEAFDSSGFGIEGRLAMPGARRVPPPDLHHAAIDHHPVTERVAGQHQVAAYNDRLAQRAEDLALLVRLIAGDADEL